jgi:hypothetical protein
LRKNKGGIIAFTALARATFSLWREIRAQAASWGQNDEVRSLVAYLFVFFVAAMSMNTFYLRYLWVPIAKRPGYNQRNLWISPLAQSTTKI